MICLICKKEFEIVTNHLKLHKMTSKDYYDKYIKNINEGICSNPHCNNLTIFRGLKEGYAKFCSVKCASNDTRVKQSKEDTMLKKYGGINPSLCKDIVEKRTYKLRNRTKEEKEITEIKKKETYIEKYGVDHPMKNEIVKKKTQDTNLEKYGNICSVQGKEVQIIIKQNNLEKYGTECPMKNEAVKEKLSNTISTKRKPIIKNILMELYDLELLNEFENNYTELQLKCNKCGNVYQKNYFNIYQGSHPCTSCYPIKGGISKPEKEIVEFIKSIIGDKVIENSRQIIAPKELDIYIPSKTIAIEYDGLWCHSEKCEWGNKDKFYHLNKTLECEKLGIHLIHIFEDEWIFKKDIVKSRLKQILNVNNSQKIHARKCIIKEIDPGTKNEFLEKYHIQGADKSIIKLGAFYNDELISVMTFGHGNISKGSTSIEGVWELNRFCSSSSYHIPGIASKLLSHFKLNYEWKEIFSYADRRWSSGNLYNKLGFEFNSFTQPNYWYIKDFKRIHRFNLRKRIDEPKDITESELRKSQGYGKIWDCGNLKFSLENI